jgi:hypothetical protein
LGLLTGVLIGTPGISAGDLLILDTLPSLRSLSATDVYGQGSTILVVGRRPDGDVELWSQNTTGMWGRDTVLPAGEPVWEVLPCDLNGDGQMDLLASTGSSHQASLYAWYQTARNGWEGPHLLFQDTLLLFPKGCLGSGRVAVHGDVLVMIFQWDADTLLLVDSFVFSETYDLIDPDLSGNGIHDLVLGTPFGPMILYLSPAGTVDSNRLLSMPTLALGVRTGDLDQDGHTDLVVHTGSEIFWWKGPTFATGPQPLPGVGMETMEVDSFSPTTRIVHTTRIGPGLGILEASFLSANGAWNTVALDTLPSYTTGGKLRAFPDGLALAWTYLAVAPERNVAAQEHPPTRQSTPGVRARRSGQRLPGYPYLCSPLGRCYPLGPGGRVPLGIPSGMYWGVPTLPGAKALRLLIP